MAGTANDDSTANVWALPATDFLLLGDMRAFVAQFTRSKKAAEKLIEDCLSGRGHSIAPRLRRRYALAEGHLGEFEPNGQSDAFYMHDPQFGIFVDYDYEANTVRRCTPSRPSLSWPTHLMGPEPRTDWTLHYFQLHRGDMEARLQTMGLMPRPPKPSPSPAAQEPSPSTPVTAALVTEELSGESSETVAETPPATSTVFAGNSEWPSVEQLKIAKAPKLKTILRKWPGLCRRYPRTYNADKVIAEEVSGGRLASHVGNVDPETARTFLRKLRTWLTRTALA